MRKCGTTVKTTKGYPRVTAGPLRHQYIHRIVAAALIGRELKCDEEVHHRDGDRLNFHYSNLIVLGNKDHGWVSAKQAYFMREIKEPADKREWDDFMEQEHKKFSAEVRRAKTDGIPWRAQDGQVKRRWIESGQA